MILTKDNLLRFIKENKLVTPTIIAENFDTSTMMASTALSELSKDKLIGISHFKLSSSPYYYDIKNPAGLILMAQKHFKSYDKEFFEKLQSDEVINDSSLTIQLRLAAENMKDFAKYLEISHEGKIFKFWVWYLRNLDETKKQILDILNPNKTINTIKTQNSQGNKIIEKETIVNEKNQKKNQNNYMENTSRNDNYSQDINKNNYIENKTKTDNYYQNQNKKEVYSQNLNDSEPENKEELYIEKYLRDNYLKIENKQKNSEQIFYSCSLKINKMTIYFDCIFYIKKPNENQVISFYISSNKPKIIFIQNAAKKILKLCENIENLHILSI